MKNLNPGAPTPVKNPNPGPCANPRRFVCKSTKVCVQIHEGLNIIKVNGLGGFAHKPSWICTQTFVDLHTNLRGFAHKTVEKPEPWPPDAVEKPEPWPLQADLCANPRRFVCKSTKVCVQIHEGLCANPRRGLTFKYI